MKVSFYTFGCTVNRAETQNMRELFLKNGDRVVDDVTADAIIINSCAVTATAEKSSAQLLNRLKKKHPHAVIALVGCYSAMIQKKGKKDTIIADMIHDKSDIVRQVYQKAGWKKAAANGEESALDADKPLHPHQQAFVKIQNGCDQRCSYCIVPLLRGESVSKPVDEINEELRKLVSQGHKEIVLAGINLALYSHMNHTLVDVLREANAIKGLERIHLSSLEPIVLMGGFIEALPEIKKLSPHFHISLQSGCDRLLSLMKRNYTFEEYFSGITQLRRAVKDAVISTDIIVGFPGESDDDFIESCQNITKCHFRDIHIFKYSKRDGTEAANMKGHVTEHKKTLRAALLQGIKMQAQCALASDVPDSC